MGYELITNAKIGDIVYEPDTEQYFAYFGDNQWLYVGDVLHWSWSEDFDPDGDYEEGA